MIWDGDSWRTKFKATPYDDSDDDDDDDDSDDDDDDDDSNSNSGFEYDDDSDYDYDYDDDDIPKSAENKTPGEYKNSDEYKLEASAEEVENLGHKLKRERAEDDDREERLERRQKRRVEEVRESQENNTREMKIKEAIRDSISKDLEKLRRSCRSMAALLQGLGVMKKAGKRPSQGDVRLAYKKALLTFHPDRVSRTDMRLQVEAEEKFKLISRLKEKFDF